MNIDCGPEDAAARQVPVPQSAAPRLSAVSMRPRTASLMRSPSRARVDCQWKAKPRISTTNPVVADSVTDSAASEPQIGSISSWITVTWRGSALTARWTASALLPLDSSTSITADDWPGLVSGQRGADGVGHALGFADRAVHRHAGQHALVDSGDDDVAAGRHAQTGIRPGSSNCKAVERCGVVLAGGSDMVDAFGEIVGDAARSRIVAACFCRFWSTICTKAPRQM